MCVEIVVFQLKFLLEMDPVAVLAHDVALLGLVAVVVGAISAYDIPVVLLPQSVLVVPGSIIVPRVGPIERAGVVLVLVAPVPSAVPIAVHYLRIVSIRTNKCLPGSESQLYMQPFHRHK